jgi:hypothetical protein
METVGSGILWHTLRSRRQWCRSDQPQSRRQELRAHLLATGRLKVTGEGFAGRSRVPRSPLAALLMSLSKAGEHSNGYPYCP